MNYYPSFDADNLTVVKSTVEVVKPDPSTLPAEAFDDLNGQILTEFFETRKIIAYPSPHTVWTKLQAPQDAQHWTCEQLKSWLLSAHNLKLTAWSLNVVQAAAAEGAQAASAVTVYPPAVVVDTAKLPPLDISKPKAMQALMRAGLGGAVMMKYLGEWEKVIRKHYSTVMLLL